MPNAFVKSAFLVGFAALLTALAARCSVPWQPVPFTLQTIPVILSGLWLGAKRGYLAQAVYLGAGAIGLPVFEGGTGGVVHIAGDTGGYLVAFPICALVLGLMMDKGRISGVGRLLLALLVANTIILGLGWAWLSLSVGAEQAFKHGVLPFLVVSVAKSAICLVALPQTWGGFRRAAVRNQVL